MRRYQIRNIYKSKPVFISTIALASLFGIVGLDGLIRGIGIGVENHAAAQAVVTPTIDAAQRRKEYRDAVLKQIALGESVTVPNDRIADLEGDFKLVPRKRDDVKMKSLESTKSAGEFAASGYRKEIEGLAVRLKDEVSRQGLMKFAEKASEDEKYKFLYVGGVLNADNYSLHVGPLPQPTADKEKECYESCETIFRVVCKEVCKWDCRIVNGEKVCEQSCSTICPEVSNIVCRRVCK